LQEALRFAILLNFPAQGAEAYSKQFGCLGLVSAGPLVNLEVSFLNFMAELKILIAISHSMIV
jgi:hypothetical protein